MTKTSGTFLNCGTQAPKGCRADAWNRVDHRRGIIREEARYVSSGLFFA